MQSLCAYVLNILLAVTFLHSSLVGAGQGTSFLHQPMPDLTKLHTRQKESGLFRPKWFAYREFYKPATSSTNPSTEEEFGEKDRICIRFNPNRTINVYSKRVRPLIQMGEYYLCGFGYGSDVENRLKSKKLGSAPLEQQSASTRQTANKLNSKKSKSNARSTEELLEEVEIKKLLEKKQLYNVDGTFSSELDSPTWMRLKADVKEHDKDHREIRTRYELSYTWGKIDPMAQKFSLGRIYRFPDKRDTFKRVGAYLAGVISVTANPHRPVIGKDFLAFQ
jgi:hypothetical protein